MCARATLCDLLRACLPACTDGLVAHTCALAVGNVPLEWYKHEDHIGYDKDGRAILRKARGDRLDALLQRNDSKKVGG